MTAIDTLAVVAALFPYFASIFIAVWAEQNNMESQFAPGSRLLLLSLLFGQGLLAAILRVYAGNASVMLFASLAIPLIMTGSLLKLVDLKIVEAHGKRAKTALFLVIFFYALAYAGVVVLCWR